MLVLKKEKQKREKKPSKFKLWHQKMKLTPRGKAILKLIYWGIFFFILFLFLGITSMFTRDDVPMNSPVEQTPEEEKKPLEEEVLPTIQEMQEEVLTGHIRYTYDIQIGGYTYLFEGDRYDTYEEGYKSTQAGTIHYYKDDTGIYQVNMDERVLINDFYFGLNENFFDLSYLFQVMNTLGLEEDPTNYSTSLIYVANDTEYRYQLLISEDEKHIIGIIIDNNQDIYYDLDIEVIYE